MTERTFTADEMREAVRALLDIGKRDLSNPKYDGYFSSLRELVSQSIPDQVCPKCGWYLESVNNKTTRLAGIGRGLEMAAKHQRTIGAESVGCICGWWVTCIHWEDANVLFGNHVRAQITPEMKEAMEKVKE